MRVLLYISLQKPHREKNSLVKPEIIVISRKKINIISDVIFLGTMTEDPVNASSNEHPYSLYMSSSSSLAPGTVGY